MQIYKIIKSRDIIPEFKYLIKKGSELVLSKTPGTTYGEKFSGCWSTHKSEFEKNNNLQLYVASPKCFKTSRAYVVTHFPELFNYEVWKYEMELAFHILISYFSEIPIAELAEDMYWYDLAQLKDGRWLVVGAEGSFLDSSSYYIIEL